LRRPDGEPWTLETFTAGAGTTGVWSVVSFSEIEQSLRLDGEYYQPLYLRYALAVSDGETLEANTTITHPTEIKRVYTESGVKILLAQNIRSNRLDFSTTVYMPRSVIDQIARNRLLSDDVVMTRSGANFGDTAVYKGNPPEIYACADCLIIRPTGVSGGYLSTYLNTEIGRALLTRGAYGMAQPHIAPRYLYTMRVPRLGENFEQDIDAMVLQAYEREECSKALYTEAEALLLAELGLDDLDLSHQPTYMQDYSQAGAAGRWDAEYFQPKYRRAMEIMGQSRKTIDDVARLVKRRFEPRPGKPFQYIEIGDVGQAGHAESKKVPGEEAPSRAQWTVKVGDVITSTVRPIRRLSALIESGQDGYVCSSGFAVLRPTIIEPEVLLVYLRLPAVCEILDLYTSASMYPAISTTDLLSVPIPIPPDGVRVRVVELVQESRRNRQESKQMLEEAKRRVEGMVLE
jgi:hypothetical protein